MEPVQKINRQHPGSIRPGTVAWVFAAIAAFNCWAVSLAFAYSELSLPFRSPGDILPFPALYFIEIAGLGIAGLFSVYFASCGGTAQVQTTPRQGIFPAGGDAPTDAPGLSRQRSFWAAVPWICAGITLTFVILGSFTIGLYLIPAFFAYLGAGIALDWWEKGDIPLHFIYFISAGIAQSLLVYLFVLSLL